MKEEEKKFEETKARILENIDVLQNTLEDCEEGGLRDLYEEIHNQIFDLYEEAGASDNYDQLGQIIIQAKTIERKLETWLSERGMSTLELEWPDV